MNHFLNCKTFGQSQKSKASQTKHPKVAHQLRKKAMPTILLMLAAQLTLPLAAMAQQAPGTKNVDLSSTVPSVTVQANQHNSATIHVGSTTMTVGAGSTLTPAEYAAFMQVVHNGSQSLVLSNAGNAVGGTINLSGSWTSNIGNLNIPSNVTVISNFGAAGTSLNLANLTNSGNIFAVSTNPAVTTAIINANNISNNQGALLTTVLPAGGLAGFGGALNNLNLQLNVLNNVVNAGTISSAANLNINAGGSIINQLPAGVSGMTPVMQAMNSLNLTSQLGSLINAGAISAVTGNVNISSLNDLVVNNLGGSIQALNGQINLRDALFSGTQSLTVTGGDWLSKELNLNSGSGNLYANIGRVSGVLNATACSAEILASSPKLEMGNLNISGDPIIGNLTGDFAIPNSITTSGSPLLIYAGGNITAKNAGTTIDSTGAGNGGDITIIAGGTAVTSGGTFIVRDCKGCGGGNIDLSNVTSINASGANGFGGGKVSILTLGGDLNAGTINVPSSITTNGTNFTVPGGAVLVIADASAGNVNSRTSINLGSITTIGGGANQANGSVTIATAHPTLASADPSLAFCQPCIGFTAPGAGGGQLITSPPAIASTITVGATQNMSIQTGAIATSGGNVTITSGFEYLNSAAGTSISTGTFQSNRASGNVNITVNSQKPFELGTVAGNSSNHIVGAIDVTARYVNSGIQTSGATVSFTNAGSGGLRVTDASLYKLSDPISSNNSIDGGNLSLNAPTAAITMDQSSGGALTSNGGARGSGGTISLNATRFINSTNIAIVANGNSTGSGGKLNLTETDAAFSTTIGSASGQFSFTANGGGSGGASGANGGQLSINAAGPISVTQGVGSLAIDPTSGNGNGGTVSLTTTNAASGIIVNGGLTLPGLGTGTGGQVTINSANTNDFVVGAGATTNGVSGAITVNGGANGPGGSVALTGAQGLVLQPATNLTANGSGAGKGGSISLTASGSNGLTIDNPNLFSATAGNTGAGGSISLTATKGQLAVTNTGTFSLDAGAAAASGAGGSFTASYDSLLSNGFIVNANGSGSGSGGSVSITQNNANSIIPFSINNSGLGTIAIHTNGGATGGGGGSITLLSAGDLTIDMTAISAVAGSGGSGAGATFTFTAGNGGTPGNLLITATAGGIVANGSGGGGGNGAGGNVKLTSNSSIPFSQVGVAPIGFKNGIITGVGATSITAQGNGTGAGGQATLDNEGSGGVSLINSSVFSIAPNGAGAGAKLTLLSPNGSLNLPAANGSFGVLNLNAGGGNNAGGSLTVIAANIVIPNILISTLHADGAGTGGGGTISITKTSDTTPLGIGANSGQLSFSAISGAGGGAGGSISVTTAGDLSVATASVAAQPANAGTGGSGANYTFVAGTVVPSSLQIIGNIDSNGAAIGNNGGGTVTLTSSNSLTVAGNVSANGAGTASGGTINLTAGSQSIFEVNSGGIAVGNIGIAGAVSANGAGGGTIKITNPGGIKVGNLADLTLTASAGAGGTLNLSAANGAIDLGAGTLSLNGVGASFNGGSLLFSSSKLSFTGALAINASGTANGGSVNITTTAPGFDLNVGGALTINAQGQVDGGKISLSSGHNLSVTTAGITANAAGASGVGTTWNLKAGTASPGDILITGNINAVGVGATGAGGAVTLSSSRNIFVNGNIDASAGAGTGASPVSGGAITINSKSNSPFILGATLLDVNGVTGTIKNAGGTTAGNEGSLTITNDGVGGITFDPSLRTHSVTNGAGGNLTLTANAGLISFVGSGTIDTSGAGTILSGPQLTPGGNITIKALGVESQGHTTINANGASGKGGDVIITATGSSSFIQLDPVANNAFQIAASGGASAGNAGAVTITAGERIQFNPAGVVADPGAGSTASTITMNATGSSGSVGGSLLVVGGSVVNHKAGSYSFIVNTTSPFVIGGVVTGGNGINGNVDLSGTGGTGGGNLTVTQSGSGGIIFAQGATINTSATGDSPNGPAFSVAGGGDVSINAGSGTITTNNNTIDARSTYFAFKGGTVTLSAATFANGAGATNPVVIHAEGGAGSVGGTINITSTGSTSNLTIGNLLGNFNLNASGGEKGGNINLNSANNLVIDPAFMLFAPTTGTVANGYGGDGGSVSLTAPAQLFVNGNLSANAVASGVGDGGSITINNTGSANNNFIISPNSGFNGIKGTLTANPGQVANGGSGSGGTININTTGVLLVNGNVPLSVSASGTAGTGGIFNGGSLTLNVPSAAVLTAGSIILSADAAGNGNGGNVSLTQTSLASAIIIGAQGGNYVVTARGGSAASAIGDGGKITLVSPTNLLMDTTQLNLDPRGANGKGGAYSLTANGNIITTNAAPAAFSANGVGIGDGGSISINQGKNGTALFIGSGSFGNGINGNLTATAGNTAGKGGIINITLSSTGALVLQAGNLIDASGSTGGGDGGQVNITTNTIAQIGLSSSTISANGNVNGNGGSINITASKSAVTLGTAQNQIALSATGGSPLTNKGDGGSITLNTLSLNVNFPGLAAGPLGNVGKGANYNFTTAQQLFINGNLTANGGTNGGDGGKITLVSGSAAPFLIGGANNTFSGIAGTLGAASVQAVSNAFGKGGSIAIQNDLGGITVANNTQFNVSGAANNKSGELKLTSAAGALSILSNAINVNGNVNGDAGSMTLSGINITGPSSGALVLSADGSSTGNGGTINITTTNAASNITLGQSTGQITVTARGGVSNLADNGGTVKISAGNNLTVNGPVGPTPTLSVDSRSTTNGNGGTINLTSGTASTIGNLFVNSNLTADGKGVGNGGTINLNLNHYNSFPNSPFTVGAAVNNTLNGVNGVISASAGNISGNGGTISITNQPGNTLAPIGVKFLAGQNVLVNSSANGTAGKITVLAQDQPITFAGASVFRADGTGLATAGGTISLTASQFIFQGANVVLSANGSGSGKGGSVTLASTGSAGLGSDISVGAAINQFSISATGGSVGSKDGGGGTVTLSTASVINNVTIAAGASLAFGPLGNVGDGGTLNITAGNNVAVTGTLAANAAVSGKGGSITITESSTNNSLPFIVGSATNNGVSTLITASGGTSTGDGGTIVINAVGVGGITLANVQNITANGTSTSASGGKGGSITLNTGANGDLTLGTGTFAVDGAGYGDGGNLTITTRNLLQPASSNPVLSAQGGVGSAVNVVSGNGGTINITTSAGNINIGNVTGTVQLKVPPVALGQGGTLNVTNTLGNINVNAAGLTLLNPLNTEGGASVSFTGSGVGSSINATGTFNSGNGDKSLLSLKATGTGSFINQTAGGLFQGRSVQLTASNSLGTALAPIQVRAAADASGSLSVNATNPGTLVFLQQTGQLPTGAPVTVGTSSAGQSWSLTSNNNITATGTITANQVNLTTTANNGSITINANVGGAPFSSTDTITANGSGAIRDLGGIFSAATVNLTSGSGNIGSVSNRATANTSNIINASTTGSAFIFNGQSTQLTATSVGTLLDFQTVGNLNVVGVLSAPSVVLGAFASQFVGATAIDGNINAGAGVLSTVANLGISVANNANLATNRAAGVNLLQMTLGGTLNLNAFGPITASAPIVASNVNIFSNNTIVVNAAGVAPITALFNSAVPGTGALTLNALNTITLGSTLTGNVITVQTLANNAGIAVNAAITGNGISLGLPNVTLRANGTGNITTNGGTSIISGNSALLNSAAGSIGAGLNPILTQLANLSIQAPGPAGSSFILQNGATPLTVGASVVGNTFSLTSSTNVTVNPVINGGTGGVSITVNSADLTVAGSITSIGAGNIQLTANNGNMTLNAGAINATGTGNVNLNVNGFGKNFVQNLGSLVVAANGNFPVQALTIQNTGTGNVTLSGTVQTLIGGDVFISGTANITQNQGFIGSAGNLTVLSNGGTVSSVANVSSIQAINGDILLKTNVGQVLWNGNISRVGATAHSVQLQATTDVSMGSILNVNGLIAASGGGNVTLNAGTINSGGTGGVNIQSTGNGATFNQAIGSVVLVNNGNVLFNNSGANSTMNLSGTVQTALGGNIQFGTTGDLNQNQGFVSAAGKLQATSSTGNLTSVVNLFAEQAFGDITLTSSAGAVVAAANISHIGAASGTITVNAATGITLGNVLNTNGAINAGTAGGVLKTNNFVAINSQGGAAGLLLQNNGTTAADKIMIGQGVQVIAISPTAGFGRITVAAGGAPVAQAGVQPANVNQVLVGTGTINYSTAGITALAPVNTLISKNSVLTFSVQGGLTSSAITLGGNDTFNADPPAGGNVAPAALPMFAEPSHVLSTASAPVVVTATKSGAQLSIPAQLGAMWSNVQNIFNQSSTTATSTRAIPTEERTSAISSHTSSALTPSAMTTTSVTGSQPAPLPNVLTGGVAKNARGLRPSIPYLRAGLGAEVESTSLGQIELKHGDIVVLADKPSTIKSGSFNVEVASGSVVHIIKEGSVTKVRNLFDQPGHSVRVLFEGKSLRVGLGEELLMGDNDGSVRASFANEKLGRRNVSTFVIGNKNEMIRSEVSIVHLIQNSKLLSSLYFKGDKSDRAVMDRVMKMAACLFQVTNKRGAYKADASSVISAPTKSDAQIRVAQAVQ